MELTENDYNIVPANYSITFQYQFIMNPLTKTTMATQTFYPLQTLRVETDVRTQKAYLVARIQCTLCQYQYMTVLNTSFVAPGTYKITLKVPNSPSSLTEIIWTGEQRFEIPYDPMDRPLVYTVETTVYKQPTGGVTNTISGNGDMIIK
jgi:hypothetical protein